MRITINFQELFQGLKGLEKWKIYETQKPYFTEKNFVDYKHPINVAIKRIEEKSIKNCSRYT